MPKPVTIVGGGLAGLTLGIALRQRGLPVTIWEAGRYPRHRVCGEFISGRGQETLARLGLLPGLKEKGVTSATSAAFFTDKKTSGANPLPEAALCLSRFLLDEWLARQFQNLGGDLREGSRWREGFGEGIVRANGRRVQPVVDGWRWFGLKTHACGVDLCADLEMHLGPSGYVGLCRLRDDMVNICGLFRSRTPVSLVAQGWRQWLGGAAGTALHARLANARFDEDSFCSVAGFSLQPHRALGQEELSIGDALTMIPPVTGNGMSMAFEAAELAIDPLAHFSCGECTWSQTRQRINQRCDVQFAARLRSAALLQRFLFHPWGRSLLIRAAQSRWITGKLFQATR